MKKLLVVTMLAAVILAPASFAETTTYTEKFIQKHTQKIVDKEKQLQEQKKANEESAAKRQKARQESIEKQKKEAAERQKARQEAIEKQKKENEAKQKAVQKKIERKKQLWNELISD